MSNLRFSMANAGLIIKFLISAFLSSTKNYKNEHGYFDQLNY